MFYEVWKNKAAFDEHGQTPHLQGLGAKLKGKTDKGGGVTFYKVVK